MIEPDSFEMIERVSRQALERHPVWAHFESEDDRSSLIAWGVPAQRVDDEVARHEYCGPNALYPVLQLDPLPPLRHLIIAVDCESRSGIELDGYLFEPDAFGLFVNGREYCLNRNLASLSKRVASDCATALGVGIDELFPVAYRSRMATRDGGEIRGSLECFW